MADQLIFSPAGLNTNNCVNVDEIVEQATRNNVDAVWAGHATENPQLPEELNKRNIVFIGPPSKAIFTLSDKIASTIIAQVIYLISYLCIWVKKLFANNFIVQSLRMFRKKDL